MDVDEHRVLLLVAGAAVGFPFLERRAHVGGRRDAEFEQFLLRQIERAVEVARERLGLGAVDETHRRIDEDAARLAARHLYAAALRSEEHTSELQSLMRISYAVFCLTKKMKTHANTSLPCAHSPRTPLLYYH